jgi:O-acetylserine/cysteine efflux transporter
MRSPATAETKQTSSEPATMGVRAALLLMVTFFGGSMPAYKLAAASFGPATANLGRFVIAASFLSFVARKRLTSARGHGRQLLFIGMFGIGLMAVFLGVGVDRGSATISSIIVGLEPIGVALAGALIVGDKPSLRSYVALVAGIAGVVVASGIVTEGSHGAAILPMLLLVGTVVTFSIYTAFVRRAGQGVDPLAVAAITQVGALFFVVPACLFDIANGGMIRNSGIHPKAAWAVVFLGVGSALGYLLLCSVLANQPSNRVAVSMFLTPLLGVVFSWLVVGEHLYLRHAYGGALVLAAIWISEGGSQRRQVDLVVAESPPV